MNREILFRGKRVDTGEWVEGNLLDNGLIENKAYFIIPTEADNFDEYEQVYPSTVGQYTGLKDKNGTKIFEGDYVKMSNNPTAEVHYEAGCFYAPINKGKKLKNLRLGYYDLNDTEVTGNIHDK